MTSDCQSTAAFPKAPLGVSFLFAVLWTFLLFFMDEGLYSLNWMMEPGAWLLFFMYALPMVLMCYLIWLVLVIKGKGVNLFLIIPAGLLAGTVLVISFFLVIKPIL